MTVAAGVGAIVASAFTGSANAEPGTTAKDPTKDDSIVTTATDENGNPYYVYNTGSEAVDDALGWLQSQIDEIVSFLNSLFGESGNTDPGAGGGIGAGIGIGGGSMAASAGISHAFGLDFSTEEKKQESVMKITGWIVFLAILVLAVWFIWPRVKKVMK